jgi:hypothetical protein
MGDYPEDGIGISGVDYASQFIEKVTTKINGTVTEEYTYDYNFDGNITKISYSTGGDLNKTASELYPAYLRDNYANE